MNIDLIHRACYVLGYEEPISVESDGTVWLGPDDDRTYPEMAPILAKAAELESNKNAARESALEKLSALGLTDAEIAALVGG